MLRPIWPEKNEKILIEKKNKAFCVNTRWLDQVKIDLKEKGCSWERIQDEELWQDRTLWRRLCSETTHN